ncbi:MAG: InlB B-repeat-containing protein [Fibrobacterota bacterium]
MQFENSDRGVQYISSNNSNRELRPRLIIEYMAEDLYNLSISGENGSVSTDPEGTEFAEGTEVELTAEANSAHEFSHWSGDVSGSENPVTLTMDSDKEVTAHFEEVTTYTIDITAENGAVDIDPDRDAYPEGEEVILTAYQDSGFVFQGWSGDAEGRKQRITLTMTENKGITAVFDERDDFDIYDQNALSIASVSSEDEYGDGRPAVHTIDGDMNTIWFTHWEEPAETYPHEIVLEMDEARVVGGLQYVPRQDSENGRIHEYEVYLSRDGNSWGAPAVSGLWRNSSDLQEAVFSEKDTAQYLRLVALSEVNGEVWASVANLDVLCDGGVSTVTETKNTAEVRLQGTALITEKDHPLQVRIITLTGRNVSTLHAHNAGVYNLNAMNITSGMYIVQVRDNSENNYLTATVHIR